MNLDGEVLQAAAFLAARGLRDVERVDGCRDYRLRRVVYELDLAARAARFVQVTAIASVTDIAAAPSLRTVECVDCGVETERPRRGRCNKCRMRRARAS